MKPFWPRTRQLLPVHLQIADAHVEELFTERARLLAAAPYGVIDLAPDDAAWTRGSLVFRSLSVLFPSGLLVRESPTREGNSLPRGAFGVFAAVAREALRGPNVLRAGATEGRLRFREHAAKGQSSLMPALHLLVDSELSDSVEAVPLGRVERNGGRLQWERGSVPVVARVAASSYLKSELTQLVKALEERRKQLLRAREERPFRLHETAHHDVPTLQLLCVVQRFLPLVVDANLRPGLPPRDLYDLLTSLYGALSSFADSSRDPPAYVHDTLGEGLRWSFAEIRLLLQDAARDQTTVLPFKRVDPSTYRLTFEKEALAGKRPFLVASGADESFLRDRVPSLLKMASPVAMPSLLQSALRGVAVAPEFEPAAVIPRRADLMAYRIDVRDPLWLDVEDRRAVTLHLPQAPASLSFSLYGIERMA